MSANAYSRQGQWEKAEERFVKAIGIRRTKLGVDLPETLTNIANLASIYRNTSRWDEAEKLLMEVIETFKTKYGLERPNTLTSLGNLALVLRTQGQIAKAEELPVQVMDVFKAKLEGEGDPDTLKSTGNLAPTDKNQESWQEAGTMEGGRAA